jgi:hypothetical protein
MWDSLTDNTLQRVDGTSFHETEARSVHKIKSNLSNSILTNNLIIFRSGKFSPVIGRAGPKNC